MSTGTGILISTCGKYRGLAEFTAEEISRAWPAHPELLFSGLEDGERALPLRDDARNWMKVTRSACDDLLAAGWTAAYVVLDDHPPLGPGHGSHLNETLPRMMAEMRAVSVSLSGYGQGRRRHGSSVKWEGHDFDLCSPDEPWKFPLHPALWRLEALREILDRLIRSLPESEHTPWAFERRGGAPDADLPENLKNASYRIDGLKMAASPYPRGLKAMRFATDVYRFAVRRIMGADARAAVDGELLGVHHYFHGPYPLFWSGTMRKGALNPDLLFFLKLTGREDWLPATARP